MFKEFNCRRGQFYAKMPNSKILVWPTSGATCLGCPSASRLQSSKNGIKLHVLRFHFWEGFTLSKYAKFQRAVPWRSADRRPPLEKLLLRSRTGPDSFIKTFHHIPSKAIQLFLKDRHTPSHLYANVQFLNAFLIPFISLCSLCLWRIKTVLLFRTEVFSHHDTCMNLLPAVQLTYWFV